MAYFGTVILASVAMYQTEKSNKLAKKFDELNILQNYSLAMSTKGCVLQVSRRDNLSITWSANHKKDAGAIILVEEYGDKNVNSLNEYTIELFFMDCSKAAIRSFEIVVEQMVCVQDSNINGLHFLDNSEAPIPIGFISSPAGTKAYPVWIGDSTFKIILKLYSAQNGILTHMIENSVPICLMMQVKLHSVCGISTLMKYKYWFIKSGNGFRVDSCESLLLEITQEGLSYAD